MDIYVVEHRTPVGRELEKLLKNPIDSYNVVMIVLSLEHFIPLLNNVIDNFNLIPTPEKVETILTIVGPLI